MDSEGGCDKNLEADTRASNNRRVKFAPRIRVLHSNHGRGCRSDSETSRELKSSDSSDTNSSSLSNSSFDDFFQINNRIILKSSGENSISQSTVCKKPSYVNEKCIFTGEAFCSLEESVNEYPETTSQSLDVTHESAGDCTLRSLPTVSPSVQMMERPEDFDRHGIAASDDSLFGVHTTNKREGALRTDVDLYKSGERTKTGELCQSGVEPNRKLDAGKSSAECQSDEVNSSVPPLDSPV